MSTGFQNFQLAFSPAGAGVAFLGPARKTQTGCYFVSVGAYSYCMRAKKPIWSVASSRNEFAARLPAIRFALAVAAQTLSRSTRADSGPPPHTLLFAVSLVLAWLRSVPDR